MILYGKMFLKVEIGPVWADWPTPHLFKTARIVGPQIHEWAIFLIKQTSIEFRFCERYSWKFFKSVHNGLIGRPLFFKTAHKMGHQIHELAFFYKMDPIWIWILCKKKLKIFQIGPLWYDWQTSFQYVQNCPQYSKYLWKIGGVINIAGGMKFAKQISPLLIFFVTPLLQGVSCDLLTNL